MGLNLEALRRGGALEDSRFFTFKDGENNIRILPRSSVYFSDEGDVDFAIKFYKHYLPTPEGKNESVICLASPHLSRDQQVMCPVCSKVRLLYKGSDADKELASKLVHKKRFFYNVIDLDNIEAGIQIMETGPTIYKDLFKFALDWGDLFNPNTGYNIKITKIPPKGPGTWTSYEVIPNRQPSSILEYLPTGWEAELDNLINAIPAPLSVEEMSQKIAFLFNGTTTSTHVVQQPSQLNLSNNSQPVYQQPIQQPQIVTPTPQPISQPQQPNTQQPVMQQSAVTQPTVQQQPVQQSTPQPQPPQMATSAAQQPATQQPTQDQDNLSCFGIAYDVSSPKCASCAKKQECMQAFLDND